jgi:hypothetical protein
MGLSERPNARDRACRRLSGLGTVNAVVAVRSR